MTETEEIETETGTEIGIGIGTGAIEEEEAAMTAPEATEAVATVAAVETTN